jgi:hypothetical protein
MCLCRGIFDAIIPAKLSAAQYGTASGIGSLMTGLAIVMGGSFGFVYPQVGMQLALGIYCGYKTPKF